MNTGGTGGPALRFRRVGRLDRFCQTAAGTIHWPKGAWRLRRRRLAAMAACFCIVSGCSGEPSPSAVSPSSAATASAAIAASAQSVSAKYPNSIVVLGHSGATGYDSEPTSRGTDALRNSWATGDNPAVDSIYLRLLAVNPAIKGHASNEAESGSHVTDLSGQIDRAVATTPLPELFLIQSVDNDIRCDGTDDANYASFGTEFAAALQRIAKGAPEASILVVSSPWASAANYSEVVGQTAAGLAANTGTGPCDLFDDEGRLQPEHLAYFEAVAARYFEEIDTSCSKLPRCYYDDGALHRLPITADDITPDLNHLSISGQSKQAAIEWEVLASNFGW